MKTYQDMMDFVADIPSNFHDHTFEMIYKWVPQIHGKLVEFGTGLAKTTIAMHYINPELEIITFDIGERYGTYKEYQKRIKNVFKAHKVKDVKFEIANSYERPLVHNLDGLFIDSEHTYDVTKEEIERWVPMVKKGGLIIMDDYGMKTHPTAVGVSQAVDELLFSKPEEFEPLTTTDEMCAVFRKL